MVLNYGFVSLRIPPGVPVGEVMLLTCLVTGNALRNLSAIARVVAVAPFLVWWCLGLTRALLGIPEYGLWALRDASHVLESLFLIVGFSFANSDLALGYFWRWLPRVMACAAVYALTYPFADFVRATSPSITSPAGYAIPLFGNYIGIPGIVLLATCYVFLFRTKRSGTDRLVRMGVLVSLAACVLLVQTRTTYIQLFALCLIFLIYRRSALKKWFGAAAIVLVIAWALPATGIQLQGRLGQAVSVEFLADHLLSVTGESREGTEGSAAGVGLRTGWWLSIYERVTSRPEKLMFGLGYGFPLVDFVALGKDYSAEGQVVREPHNSYISIVARIGIVGLLSFIWMHFILIRTWRRAYRFCVQTGETLWTKRLLVFLVFFVIIWLHGIGEDAFEKPYITIPYYFCWGIVLNVWHRIRRESSRAGAAL